MFKRRHTTDDSARPVVQSLPPGRPSPPPIRGRGHERRWVIDLAKCRFFV